MSSMYGLQQNLKYIKENLKKWNKESFENVILEKQKLEIQIEELQTRMMEEGYIENTKSREQELLQEMM